MTDSEWEERQKTRQLEMEAVSKALAVLSGDDAHARWNWGGGNLNANLKPGGFHGEATKNNYANMY